MSLCSPGCACTVSLRGAELDPGPVAMATMGTNHSCGLVVRQWTPEHRGAMEQGSAGGSSSGGAQGSGRIGVLL